MEAILLVKSQYEINILSEPRNAKRGEKFNPKF